MQNTIRLTHAFTVTCFVNNNNKLKDHFAPMAKNHNEVDNHRKIPLAQIQNYTTSRKGGISV